MESHKTRQTKRFYVSSIRSYIKIRNQEIWNASKVEGALVKPLQKVKQAFELITDKYTHESVCRIIKVHTVELRIITAGDHRPNSNKVKMIVNQVNSITDEIRP
jgi:hypothetical protein